MCISLSLSLHPFLSLRFEFDEIPTNGSRDDDTMERDRSARVSRFTHRFEIEGSRGRGLGREGEREGERGIGLYRLIVTEGVL